MAALDSPLKQLVSAFIVDFAAWILHADIREAHALNVELPGGMLTADQVFHVTLADGRALVLHIEFQGRASHQPMKWRMLEYMATPGIHPPSGRVAVRGESVADFQTVMREA
jgi:hypothetical protein